MRIPTSSLIFAVAIATWAGRSVRAAAPQPEAVIHLTIRPVATTQPSLQYRFLPEVVDQTEGNAATLYLIGFKFGPDPKQAEDLMDQAWKLLELPSGQFPPDKAEQVLEHFPTKLRYGDLAAHRSEAQWDPAVREEGLDSLLPYITDCRGLAVLWALQARARIAKGDWPGAARAIGDGLTLARQLNHQAGLVQGLVEASDASDILERGVRDWVSRPDAPNLYWSLSSLPYPFIDVHEIGRSERSLIYFTFPVLRDARHGATSTHGWRTFIEQLPDLSARVAPRAEDTLSNQARAGIFAAASYPQARAYLLAAGRTPQQLDEMSIDQTVGTFVVEQYGRLADEEWKAWELPFWEGGAELRRWAMAIDDRAKPGITPLADALAPRVTGARFMFARLDREIALLRIVEAVRDFAARHEGQPPDSLNQIKDLPIPIDPVRGQPFRYERHGQNVTIEAPSYDERPGNGERYELTVVK